MKVLVIGLGSIAQKHITALRALVPESKIYALRSDVLSVEVAGVSNCYTLDDVPRDINFIIISNPTSLHLKTIKEVSCFEVPLFVEKPPIDSTQHADQVLNLVESLNLLTYTAFNLRFHPVVQWLKKNIKSFRVIEVSVYCGSYLPDWRPNKDYRQVYSARKELGGGVHLDLTHEIDYLLWLFGNPVVSKSTKRKISDLDINSVDSAKYWLEYQSFTVNLTLNYFRKDSKRLIEIVTNTTTLECDLLTNRVTDLLTREVVAEFRSSGSFNTYIDQMKYFIDCIETNTQPMNSLRESVRTMKVCLE